MGVCNVVVYLLAFPLRIMPVHKNHKTSADIGMRRPLTAASDANVFNGHQRQRQRPLASSLNGRQAWKVGCDVDFKLKDVMEAVGPSAALAFAAWLFLQLLQQRYSAAYTRYRELVDSFRNGIEGKRGEVIKDEIMLYRKRVIYMLYATNVGMVAAILLLLALISSAVDAVFKLDWLKYIGAPGIVLGFLLVAAACVIVIVENSLIKKPIEAELDDLDELKH